MGRALRDRLNHLLRADRVFLEVDEQARAGYSQRIEPSPLHAVPASEPAPARKRAR
jgi:hypothetical protein